MNKAIRAEINHATQKLTEKLIYQFEIMELDMRYLREDKASEENLGAVQASLEIMSQLMAKILLLQKVNNKMETYINLGLTAKEVLENENI